MSINNFDNSEKFMGDTFNNCKGFVKITGNNEGVALGEHALSTPETVNDDLRKLLFELMNLLDNATKHNIPITDKVQLITDYNAIVSETKTDPPRTDRILLYINSIQQTLQRIDKFTTPISNVIKSILAFF